MTTPHHSEPAREAVALPSEITEAQINSACLSYRHDFGLLDEYDKERLRIVAKEWLHAWRKEFTPMAPALKLAVSPAPAASGGLEALGKPEDWAEKLAELYAWSGSAFLAGEKVEDEAGHKSRLYGFLCGLIGYLMAGRDAALAAPAATGGEAKPLPHGAVMDDLDHAYRLEQETPEGGAVKKDATR